MVEEVSAFSDVACSICGRHNREVRVVATENGLIVCQVCVAKCAVSTRRLALTRPTADGSGVGH